MALIETPFLVTPINGDTPFDVKGSIGVVATIFPPGIGIELSLPPFTITLTYANAAALAAELLALIP